MLTLAPFQQTGVAFLASKKFALLADEQRVGKTAQILKAAEEIGADKILIICPAVVRVNWQREAKTWADFTFTVLLKLTDEPNDLSIVSYEYATENYELLKGIPWDLVICDESHFIKEPTSLRTQRIYGKNGIIRVSDRLWCSSGTPAPNHAGELWPLLYTFGQTALSYEDFVGEFCEVRPTFYAGKRQNKIVGTKTAKIPQIKEMLSPVMLRRLRSEVLSDLPPKNIEILTVEGSTLPEAIAIEQNIITREIGYLTEAMAIAGENLEFVLERIGSSVAALRRYTGLMKVKNTCEIVKGELENNEYQKIILFAVHTDVIAYLKKELEAFGAVVITGKTPQTERQIAIDSFQNKKEVRVFIGNIVAAGTGINLNAASEVVMVEQSWVPGENAQASDRPCGRGQKGAVRVRVATLYESLDEKINTVLVRKMKQLSEIFNNNP
jgi:SWI/SNF-related matrix-associated actin-dependent regulator of chromatin subfamily A-like protein 1